MGVHACVCVRFARVVCENWGGGAANMAEVLYPPSNNDWILNIMQIEARQGHVNSASMCDLERC